MSELQSEDVREFAVAAGGKNVEIIDLPATLRKYLRCLRDDPEFQGLSSSYVPLRVTPFQDFVSDGHEGEPRPESDCDTVMSTSDILSSVEGWGKIVLIGKAGAGKTATLRWLAHEQAQRLLDAEKSRVKGEAAPVQYLPLYVELPPSGHSNGLEPVLLDIFEKYGLAVPREGLIRILEREPILFLLDGLERVRDNYLLDELARLVEMGNRKCIVACRTDEYGAFRRWLEDPYVLELADLNDEDRMVYIQSQLPASVSAVTLWRARADERLWKLLRIPLFLASLVELAREETTGLGWIRSSDVVEVGVQRLLEAMASLPGDLGVDEARGALAALALQSHLLGAERAAELDREQIAAQLGPVGIGLSRHQVSSLASTGALTVSKREDTISFAEPMVRDFLAALAISESYSGSLSTSICLDSDEVAQHWEGVLIHLYHFLSDRRAYLEQLLETQIDGWGPRIAAECLAYNESPHEARQLAGSLALVDTLDPVSVYRLGQALKGLRKYEEATALFEGMLSREQDDIPLDGKMLGYREKYPRSGSESSRLEKPGRLISRRNLGLLYRELDQPDRAVSELEEAVEGANAAHSDTYHELGLAYLQQERLEDALTSFQHAIALNPQVAAYHCSVGVVLNRLQRFDEAQAELQQAIMLDPDDARSYLELGYAHERQEWYGEALAAYEAAEARDPREASCPRRIGKLLALQERWGQAVEALQRALALAPNQAD